MPRLTPRQRWEVSPAAGHCFFGGAALRETRYAQTVASLNQPPRKNKAWPLCLSGKPPNADAHIVEPDNCLCWVYLDRGTAGGQWFSGEHKGAIMEGANSDEAEPCLSAFASLA